MPAADALPQRNPDPRPRKGSAHRRPVPVARYPRAGDRVTAARAARDLDALALILEATRKRAEAVAARRIAADLRRPWPSAASCPICRHRHPRGTACCTLCHFRSVRP